MNRGMRAGCAVILCSLLAPVATATPTFDIIGQDFVGGVWFIDGSIRPSIAENGTVVFAGNDITPGVSTPVFFTGDGVNPHSKAKYTGAGYNSAAVVKIDSAGNLAFVGTRTANPHDFRGIYRTNTMGTVYSTVFEVEQVFGPPPQPSPQNRLAMSGNGTIAFSNIQNGDGDLYTATQGNPATILRAGSGTFFNNLPFDVNDSGAVAIQMEYTDPNNGLSRGILVFDTPGEGLAGIETAVERTGVGVQPKLAMNNLGQVAFILESNITIQYFDPPLPGGGNLDGTQSLTPGVYMSTPSAFGTPFAFTKVADTSGAFESFSEIRLNDDGTIVLQASVEVSPGNFETGIYTGGDPVADELVRTGKTININGEDNFFSILRLGDLNHQNQLTFQTSDFITTDQRVWRVNNVPEPTSFTLLLGAVACLRLRDLRG